MRIRPQPRNWVSGELAPWLDGLPGELINSGAKTLENFVVKKQGAIQRRPGSFYVASVKNAASETILIQCEIDSSNIYVLEMGNAYVRFYKNHAQVSLAAAAYEVASPYSTADLTDLRWTYIPNEKALYFAHHNYALRRLKWTSDASWELSAVNVTALPAYALVDSNGGFITSDDLSTWSKTGVGGSQTAAPNYFDLIFTGDAFLAANNGNPPGIYRSEDGENWLAVSTGWAPSRLCRNQSKEVVAVGATGCIYMSYDDGETWVSRATGATLALYAVAVNPATGSDYKAAGTSVSLYSSDSGLTWSNIALTSGTEIVYEIVCHSAGLWVGAGQKGAVATIYYATSVSGAWVSALSDNPTVGIRSLAKGTYNGSDLWVAASYGGKTYKSTNGTTWASSTILISIGSSIFETAAAKDAMYVFGSTGYAKTTDGVTYTSYDYFASGLPQQTRAVTGSTMYDANLGYEWFDQSSHFPKSIAYHEGRLIIGPTDNNPSTIWGSKTNAVHNFYIGQFSDQGFSYDLASDRNVAIQWMIGGPELAIGTRTAEGVLRGSPEEGITPQTARMIWQSTFGSDNIQPVRIHDTIIFTQRGGEIVRGYIPGAGTEAWKSPDLTAFADHIARGGITEIDHQDDPQTVAHFVRSDGYGLGLTFEGTTRAWWRTKMGATAAGYGRIESQCVIPTSGAEDELWAIVKWTVNGSVKRYIVYFDAYYFATKQAYHGVDCGYYNSAPASATVYSAVVPQLAGEAVTAVINGSVVENNLTVAAGGTVTIAATNATSIHIGLPYTSYAQTMRINPNSAWGSGAGITKRNGNLNVWVYNTIGGTFGPTSSVTEPNSYVSTTDLTTDCLSIPFPGQWDRDGYIWCIQSDPLPMTIVAIAPDMELGDR